MSTQAPRAIAPRYGAVATLCAIALISIATIAMLVLSADNVSGVYGWNTGPDGQTVTSVTPGYPADRAGIRAGDVVDYRSLSLLGRVNTIGPQAVSAGEPLVVRFVRSGVAHTITMKAAPISFASRSIWSLVSGIMIIAVGSWLVLVRPSRMTWGFLLLGVGQLANVFIYRFGSPGMLLGTQMLRDMGVAAGWAGVLIFASRFPDDKPQGFFKLLDRAAIPLAAVYLALRLYTGAALLYSQYPPAYGVSLATEYILLGLFALIAAVALLVATLTATGNAWQRLVPVTVTFMFWTLAAAADITLNALYTTPFYLNDVAVIGAASLALFTIAVAYGIVRHRVIDVNFVISRTLAYAIVTAIVLGVFAIIDILVARLLERSQLAIVLELIVAVLMGISLRAMHRRIDTFVDSVLFRRRHVAERRLARIARALPHASTFDFVDETLVEEPVRALGLASAAVFRKIGDGRFERRRSYGWDANAADAFGGSDQLVVQLAAELEPMSLSDIRWSRTDIPGAVAQPLLAVPIVVRHQLTAFAMYGGHTGGEALDPDEIRSLRLLAEPAASAYDHLEAVALSDQNERLRTLNSELQLEQQLNSNTIDLIRNQMAAIDELLRRSGQPAE